MDKPVVTNVEFSGPVPKERSAIDKLVVRFPRVARFGLAVWGHHARCSRRGMEPPSPCRRHVPRAGTAQPELGTPTPRVAATNAGSPTARESTRCPLAIGTIAGSLLVARTSLPQSINDRRRSVMEGSTTARDAAEQAKQTAGEATEKARNTVQQQLDRRSTEAGEQVGSTAEDMRAVAEQLRSQEKERPAELAERAADQVERVGGYLRDADSDRMLRDVEDFGRRQPWAVVAGGLLLGFAASRFLKASSSRRYEQGHAPSPERSPRLGDGRPRESRPVATPSEGGAVTPDPPAAAPVGGGVSDA